MSAYALDTCRVRRSFDRAARGYDAAAALQGAVREQLLARLDLTALAPEVVLDAGAGTAHASRALKARYPRARVLALDSSAIMLREAARRFSWRRRFARVCADAAQLPLADSSVDLVFSNLMLPWSDPDAVFREFRRVLRPRGLLTFTSAGPDTLKELRAAWGRVDQQVHVHRFIDMHDLGDALVRAGFAAPVLDVDFLTLKYADLQGLKADLKGSGTRNLAAGAPRGLMGRRKLAALSQAYEAFRRDGRLPATYEIVYGQAWGPLAVAGRGTDAARLPGGDLRRRGRARRGGGGCGGGAG